MYSIFLFFIPLFLCQITTTDNDSGMDGQITYNILSDNKAGLFSITNDGNVTVTGILDREATPNFFLTIQVSV